MRKNFKKFFKKCRGERERSFMNARNRLIINLKLESQIH